MTKTFRCGHPKTEDNSYKHPGRWALSCRQCQTARAKEWREKNRARHLDNARARRLPEAIANTRRKLEALLVEAERRGISV